MTSTSSLVASSISASTPDSLTSSISLDSFPLEKFDVENVLAQLTRQEKIDLLSGIDFWHTKAIPRLGVGSIRLSDGPNGVRGTRFFNGVPAACFPCGTALAATWNAPLLQEAGVLMGEEAKAKGAHVLLGPTVNMQRSPLGGRGFESFSEDPVLAGNCAAAVVNGIQETGIAAGIKHFVCNDQEHQRMAVDALVTERALREIYLLPFQIAIKDARPRAFMSSYNKVNGTHVSEHSSFLKSVLRGEWAWNGLVVSDWYGTYSTAEAMNAGLDLEMPGPTRYRGDRLLHALQANKVSMHTFDSRVREVLRLISDASKSGVPENAPETTRDTPETRAFLRRLASESIVLVKNDNNVLPLNTNKTVAVIGPNAKVATYCGGGSAAMAAYYAITPFEGIRALATSVQYSLGCYAHKMLPLLGSRLRTETGRPGVTFRAYNEPPSVMTRQPVDTIQLVDTYMYLADYYHPALDHLYWVEISALFIPDETGQYEFGLTVFGLGKLYLDDELVVDNETAQRPGGTFFDVGTVEETGQKHLVAGQTYRLRVDYSSGVSSKLQNPDGAITPKSGGIRIGGARVIDPQEEIDKAVQLAREVDQVVLCMGLNNDWESESYDRQSMSLPDPSDALVTAVLAANPNAVIVIQSGTPVSMPWAQQANGIIQAWYGGNECGSAIADILFGEVNPSGKLPLTFPIREEDNPAYLSFSAQRGRVLYSEDFYVGYRWYEAVKRETKFPFGYGLSYTSFTMEKLDVVVDEDTDKLVVEVDVINTGSRDGMETVQIYISQDEPSVPRPVKELKGFKKVNVKNGARERIRVEMALKYATSFWDEARESWVMEQGFYRVMVGNSSVNVPLRGKFKVGRTNWWNGV